MKFLVDMPLSPALARWLSSQGHDAVHAAELTMHRSPDTDILARARAEGRIVVTADLDFPRLLALTGEREPGVVLLRSGNYSDVEARELVARVLAAMPPERLTSAIVVVDQRRIRRTTLPVRPPTG